MADQPAHKSDSDTIERRAVFMPVELRAIGAGPEGSRTIGGYAAVFNSDSRMIPRAMGGTFIERVTPGFFEEARSAGWPGNQGSGVMCRYNHNDQYLLGTTSAGTCTLNIDRTGLEYRAEVPQCRDDVLELIGRGDISQSSFTFMDAQDDWSYSGGITQRTLITAGAVLDVAPLSAVAGYQDTTVSLRSLAAFKDVPVEDVFVLAQQHELRRLWIRTDKAPSLVQEAEKFRDAMLTLVPNEVRAVDTETPAEQLSLEIGDGKPEERNVSIEVLHNGDGAEISPAPTEPAVAPPADAATVDAPEWEPPATLGYREAHLHLFKRRPYDPIVVK